MGGDGKDLLYKISNAMYFQFILKIILLFFILERNEKWGGKWRGNFKQAPAQC